MAGSEIFDFTREELTVSKRDFYGPYIGGEIGARINERWDVALFAAVLVSMLFAHTGASAQLDDDLLPSARNFESAERFGRRRSTRAPRSRNKRSWRAKSRLVEG